MDDQSSGFIILYVCMYLCLMKSFFVFAEQQENTDSRIQCRSSHRRMYQYLLAQLAFGRLNKIVFMT